MSNVVCNSVASASEGSDTGALESLHKRCGELEKEKNLLAAECERLDKICKSHEENFIKFEANLSTLNKIVSANDNLVKETASDNKLLEKRISNLETQVDELLNSSNSSYNFSDIKLTSRTLNDSNAFKEVTLERLTALENKIHDLSSIKVSVVGGHKESLENDKKSCAQAAQMDIKLKPSENVVTYCKFPPNSSGNITVTNEDYMCLRASQFINDVIIDFFLKYLQYNNMELGGSDIDGTGDQLLKKTHIFTSYFYKRLTTKPSTPKGFKHHPIEDNPELSEMQKMYERVRKWTKKVNLFEKDFIVVPINEKAHWYVCIICYPGELKETGQKSDFSDAINDQAQEEASKEVDEEKEVVSDEHSGIEMEKGVLRDVSIADPSKLFQEGKVDANSPAVAESHDDVVDDFSISVDEAEKKSVNNDPTPGENKPKPTNERKPCILIFDSLPDPDNNKADVCEVLRSYLSMEWEAKVIGESKLFTEQNMAQYNPRVRGQKNSKDCGIFLLQYVESFFRAPVRNWTDDNIEHIDWFQKEEVMMKRANIAKLIRNLSVMQDTERKLIFPELDFRSFESPVKKGMELGRDCDEDQKNSIEKDLQSSQIESNVTGKLENTVSDADCKMVGNFEGSLVNTGAEKDKDVKESKSRNSCTKGKMVLFHKVGNKLKRFGDDLEAETKKMKVS